MNTFFINYSDDANGFQQDKEQYCFASDGMYASSKIYRGEGEDEKSVASTETLSTLESSESLNGSFSTLEDSSPRGHDEERHVCFNEEINQYHENHIDYEDGELQSLWYTVSDYSDFRATASSMAKQTHRTAYLSITQVLEQALQDCCPIINEEDSEDENDHQDTEQEHIRHRKPNWPLRRLHQLYTGNCVGYFVGLEVRVSRILSKERRLCRRELAQVIYRHQASIDSEFERVYHADERAEQIRRQCQQVTRRARIFAHLMAQAQVDAGDVLF